MEITRHFSPLPIFFMHCLMVYSIINANAKTNLTTDKHALLSLKSRISLDPYNILSNWSINSSSPCNWVGVTCGSRHNRVIALDLSNMSLVGELTPHLGNLSFLDSLNLNQNNFHSVIPREFSQLQSLKTLQCSANNFSGEIPFWLGLLPNLRFLYLGSNSFSGFLPTSLFNLSKLEVLHLGDNSLQGSVPREIGTLPQLKWLNLSLNYFSGFFSLGILNLSTLETLSLSVNSFSGNLPLDLGNHLSRLQTIALSNNKFGGEIPPSIFKCSQLQTISLVLNNFSGPILKEFENLTKLESLDLKNNSLKGIIPNEIGNLTKLRFLRLESNTFAGVIPQELEKLQRLEYINLQFGNLSGSIPKGIFNISSLQIIAFVGNQLMGTLPSSFGHSLPNLQKLYLGANFLSGLIPDSISNCSNLVLLSLSGNEFSGTFPASLGNLRFLEKFGVQWNRLTNVVASSELSIINSLVNCKYLRELLLSHNPLHAILPASIGNLSSSLEILDITRCGLKGIVPNQLRNLSSLIILYMSSNDFTGFMPSMQGWMPYLQGLDLSYNKFSGPISRSLCELQYLSDLHLENNQISGSLPTCFGNSTSLRTLTVGSNRLASGIPSSLCYLKDLLELDLSSNFFDGFLPIEVGGLKALYFLNVSDNKISGNIPTTVGQLQNLKFLLLALNRLGGTIPKQISQIVSLEFLDLSLNKISGSIPVSLQGLTYLEYFNVSFNELSGEIPSGGCFKNFTRTSFMFNKGLCGVPQFDVPPCNYAHRSRIKIGLLVALTTSGLALIITFVIIIAFIFTRQQKKHEVPSVMDIPPNLSTNVRISYYQLSRATCGFNQSNLIGSGSFSSVYKGILDDGMHIAVKVFNQSEDALKSFDVDCEMLKNLRHRNLTKVITGCFTENFKALILEYMSNGSLDQWLHSQSNYFLDMVQRLDIMIDVACALEYLHHGYSNPVVHCDLKPANVLLDEEMVAHVSDFSVTKLLTEEESFTQTKTLATLGYMAPEYGSMGMVSTQCDTYSYGIVLMETFSNKRPMDDTFSEDMSLKSWIRDSIPQYTLQVIDPNLLNVEDRDFTVKLECVSSILELALQCVVESPGMRLNMKDVVARLNRIKLLYISKR